jgi:hypothetical protein
MNERELDHILEQSAGDSSPVDPALLARLSQSLGGSLTPVRPLPAPWVLASGLAVICMAVASVVAAILGLYGARRLTGPEATAIFLPLVGLVSLSATLGAAQIVPGSRRWLSAGALLASVVASLVAVFLLLFHDYHMTDFVPVGRKCLIAGLVTAVPAALLGWLIMRRGFAVDRIAAGIAAGTLAGLAGVAMLELHCPNSQVLHLLLWHTGVVPLSAAAGAAIGRLK